MMKYTTISDSHVHSCFSHDGNDPVMMLCDYAVKMGLYALTITDHCECNMYEERNYAKAIKDSFVETKRAAAALSCIYIKELNLDRQRKIYRLPNRFCQNVILILYLALSTIFVVWKIFTCWITINWIYTICSVRISMKLWN